MDTLSALGAPWLLLWTLSLSLLLLVLSDSLISLDMLLLDLVLVKLHFLVIHKIGEISELALLGWTVFVFVFILAILLFFLKL